MAAYKMAAVKVTPPNDFPLGLIRSHGCYPSIPHALRFTKGGKGLMPHPALIEQCVIECYFLCAVYLFRCQCVVRSKQTVRFV
jgi:hypothetical protein